ncbi:MAG: CheY-like chemotaxis protein [Planctomycetota bacterium]
MGRSRAFRRPPLTMFSDRRMLIADDDNEVRLGAVELLGSLGLEIIQVDSGSAAIEELRSSAFHLALLDVHMPGHTGVEVFQQLREEDLTVPCIFWSGDAPEEVQRYLIATGADDVLRKPVNPAELRASVSRVLQLHWGDCA